MTSSPVFRVDSAFVERTLTAKGSVHCFLRPTMCGEVVRRAKDVSSSRSYRA